MSNREEMKLIMYLANMRKLSSFIFLLFLLTACAASPAADNTTPAIRTVVVPTLPPCTSFQIAPTPGPENPSVFPPESGTDRVRGAQDPLVTIVEYSDYQDGRSGFLAFVLNRLLEEHPDEVRVVSRIFPILKINDKAALAAQAAEAAAEQDKFWEMRMLLFSQQETWVNLSAEDFEQWVGRQASTLGMNAEQFQSDLKRADIVTRVQEAWEAGQKMGLPGTPFVLINGQIYGGPRNYDSLKDIVELIAIGKRQFSSCPPMVLQQDRQYFATLHTAKGDIVIQLLSRTAPMTVNSFVFLARNRWYDNITFHRVVPNAFAQTGDPSGTGKGHPGYYIITEIVPSVDFSKPGMVAMVNSGPDTSGSQFFITTAPLMQYNGQYTIFGEVISGMDVVKQLTAREAKPGMDTPPGDQLLSVTIEER